MVALEVADTGTGIDPEAMSHLFEPFFTTKAAIGTGLGLSISHRIVESMSGRIEVEARSAGGTCFRVLLPLSEAELAPNKDAAECAQPSEALEILVVDDLPAVLRSVKRMLKPHKVTTAASGREALERLGEQRYELVLCDLMMPEMTGIDVYNTLKERSPGDEARLTFMTGGVFTAHAQSFLAEVDNECLHKPFTADELKAFVARQLGNR